MLRQHLQKLLDQLFSENAISCTKKRFAQSNKHLKARELTIN